MWTSLTVLLTGAALTAAAAFWVLRAFRRAGADAKASRAAVIGCALVGAVGLSAYLVVGRPELPDAPYHARLMALKDRDPATLRVDEALAVLAQAARDNPGDPLPHLFTGQVLLAEGRAPEAARAFDQSLRRDPRQAEALLGLGRALVQIDQGSISPEAQAAFQQAGALTNDATPWIYLAMAAIERNDETAARAMWREALARMAPDDPRREMALRMSAGE